LRVDTTGALRTDTGVVGADLTARAYYGGYRTSGYYGTYGGYYGTYGGYPGGYYGAYTAGGYPGSYYGGYANRSYVTGRPTLLPRYYGVWSW
jgi:hypothetical protein